MRTIVTTLALYLAANANAADPMGPPNRLAKESSPYLLQHAHNPVDWFPWGDEAFAKAKKEGKLIFLSIGYSSCHWCHVMEKESFSDAEVAKILNEHFVCIKVDREERPDIDEIYMTAVQVIGGSGGWPLNVFLTADCKPIVGGTYWPKEDKKIGDQTVNGFKTILRAIIDLHKDKPKELAEQADRIATATGEFLARAAKAVPLAELEPSIIQTAVESFMEDIDPEHGGIGRSERQFVGTKFPMPAAIGFLYEQTRREPNRELRILMRLTLEKMACGGIYDQLGGGFHRYSTERTWTVPHFEKMLYDNAQLVELYALAQATEPQPLYRRTIEETLGFIAREMTSPAGAFYSALDADSNGTEGEFYVWTADEIEKILGSKDDAILFKAVYGSNPNFEKQYQILKLSRPLAEVAKEQRMTEEELIAKITPMKAKLFEVRAKRERPFLDTKVLTGWNGQMIAGYAAAGRVLKNPQYLAAAKKAADFILTNLRTKEGRLLHVYANGQARLNAYQDDYAFVIHGLLNLHDATDEAKWLDAAKSLTETMIQNHGEEKHGGYFFTSHDHEKLFARSKDHYDGAQPSGNAMAARNFLRLFEKTGHKGYRDLAERSYTQFAGVMKNNPTNVPAMLYGLGAFLDSKKASIEVPERNFVRLLAEPLDSSGVVKATIAKGQADGGKQKFTVTLEIAEPWHLYANPVKSPMLKSSETSIAAKSGGKKLTVTADYPAGKLVEDPIVGDHVIWEGTVVIPFTVERDAADTGPIDLAIKIAACEKDRCLRPATIKITTK